MANKKSKKLRVNCSIIIIVLVHIKCTPVVDKLYKKG